MQVPQIMRRELRILKLRTRSGEAMVVMAAVGVDITGGHRMGMEDGVADGEEAMEIMVMEGDGVGEEEVFMAVGVGDHHITIKINSEKTDGFLKRSLTGSLIRRLHDFAPN